MAKNNAKPANIAFFSLSDSDASAALTVSKLYPDKTVSIRAITLNNIVYSLAFKNGKLKDTLTKELKDKIKDFKKTAKSRE